MYVILQYVMDIMGSALVSDDSHPLSQNKLLQWNVMMIPLHTEKISVGLDYVSVSSSAGRHLVHASIIYTSCTAQDWNMLPPPTEGVLE